jgi:hypothetical protein
MNVFEGESFRAVFSRDQTRLINTRRFSNPMIDIDFKGGSHEKVL